MARMDRQPNGGAGRLMLHALHVIAFSSALLAALFAIVSELTLNWPYIVAALRRTC